MRPEHWIYTVPLRLRSLFRREQVEQDLEEEIRDHLERRTADYIAQGLPRAEARYAVQREFGGIEQSKEECRDMRKVNWIYDLAQDAAYTLRQLRKNPGFAAVAMFTLALGIGANTAMFTVIDSVLLRPLPFRNSDRLVSIRAMSGPYENAVCWSAYRDIRTRSRLLEDVIGIGYGDLTVIGTPQGGQKVCRAVITANVLDVLGVHPALGRPFDSKDYKSGAAPVVLLGAELWRDRFGADPLILGRQVRLGGVPHTVVGIMPDSFHFTQHDADITSRVWVPSHSEGGLSLTGRLRPGVTPQAVQAELATFVQDTYNQDAQCASNLKFIVKPYRDAITASVRPALLALTGALFLVLAIACVNVANVQLARHLARLQELAVRVALGAGRSRLLRQLTAEGAVLAIAGALAGLGFASIMLLVLHRLPPNFMPRAEEIHFRVPVFAMLAVFAAVTTILSSLAPALLATRTHLEEVLREGSGRSSPGRKRSRLSEWMVAGEVALSVILLVSTGLMFHTLYNLEHIRLGFDLDRVTTFSATPADAPGYLWLLAGQRVVTIPQTESIVPRVYQPILGRLRQLPGVVDVALSAWAPFDRNTMWIYFQVHGHPESERDGTILAQICYVSSAYARVMGTPLIEGRMISDDDTATSPLVAVVNETFARRAFPCKNPLGEHIVNPAKKTYTIVGVLADARQHDLTHTPDPEVVMAYQQVSTADGLYFLIVASGTNYILRTRGDVELANTIRQIFRQSAPDYALDHFRTLRGALDEATFNQRLGLYLTSSFAGVAILMVLTGLYGVLSQLVSQRRWEIGIRMALGASRGSIQGMILRRASVLTIVGLAVGLPASLAVGRLLRAFLYGVKSIDELTYFAVAIGLLAVSIAAALMPARSAAKTDFRTALQ
jgi:putative ABC transport system permease protein